MNDLKPFKHGEEGTHYSCDVALQEGLGCCGCNNHDCVEAGAEGFLAHDPIKKRLEFENVLIWNTRNEIKNIIRKWKNDGDKPTETDLVLENILKEIAKLK